MIVTTDSVIVTNDSGPSPKSVTIKRNCRSRSNGIVGHVQPEIAVTMVRNTHIDKPIIAMCGSGVVAPILAMSLHRLGRSNWKVYDGSWYEWAQLPQVPKVWTEKE